MSLGYLFLYDTHKSYSLSTATIPKTIHINTYLGVVFLLKDLNCVGVRSFFKIRLQIK